MLTLAHSDLLALWETGRSLHHLDQGVLAVESVFPESPESVADWPIGRRNSALAELHSAAFGPVLRGWTACRQCAEQLEFQMDVRTFAESGPAMQPRDVVVGEQTYRLPTSRDLAAIANEQDNESAVRRLLQQCCVSSSMSAQSWTDEEVHTVGERMAAADPLAEILLRFDCPNCGASFDEALDLPAFLWAEMEGRAKRLLHDVHTLALAYGWTEQEIVSLSPARREVYLEMVRA
jgi:hypothetical protein